MASGFMLGWINLADAGVVSASSSVANLGPEQLQDPVLTNRWRSGPGSSAHITVDLGAALPVSYVGVLGHNLGSSGGTPSWTILGSTVSIGGSDVLNLTASATGLYADTTPAAKRFGQPSGRAHRFFNSVSPRYLDILLSDSSLSYIQAGRLVVMLPTEMGHAMAWGHAHSRADGRLTGQSRGGQVYARRGPRQRRWRFSAGWASEAEGWAVLDAMDAANGQTDDVLVCLNKASAYLDQVTLWGLAESRSELTVANLPTRRQDFVVAERL